MAKKKRKPFECWAVVDVNERPYHMRNRREAERQASEWDMYMHRDAPHRTVLLREVIKPKKGAKK